MPAAVKFEPTDQSAILRPLARLLDIATRGNSIRRDLHLALCRALLDCVPQRGGILFRLAR